MTASVRPSAWSRYLGAAMLAAGAGLNATARAQSNAVAGTLRILDDDGGWCWFEGARALILDGTLYVGAVSAGVHDETRRGDINVVMHDIASGHTRTIELHDRLERDDHDSPGLLVRPDRRLLAVYSRHGSDDLMRWRTSVKPGDATQWNEEQTMPGRTKGRGLTYSNLARLAGEGERGTIYDFFRGADWDPTLFTSSDGGTTWSEPVKLITGPGRPYMRYASDGDDTIHFACTERHPRDFDTGIRHGFLRRGEVHDSAGRVIGTIRPAANGRSAAPVDALTIVRAGAPDAVAWCSDIQLDRDGRPVIVYSVQMNSAGLPRGRGGDDCRYRYARWDGDSWHDVAVGFAGSRLYANEDDYTGLITIDPRDTSTVYLSSNADPLTGAPLVSNADGRRHYELFRGRIADDGTSWRFEPITRDSTVDNIRPLVAASPGGVGMLVWMRGTYRTYQDFDTDVVALGLGAAPRNALAPLAGSAHPAARTITATFDPSLEPEAISSVATAVASWQMKHESRHPKWDWTQGAYHVGIMHWAMTTHDHALADAMHRRFADMGWALGPRPFMADDHCVGYAYQQLAVFEGDASNLGPTKNAMDAILARTQDEPLVWRDRISDREWAWCDALFMGPPTLAHMSVITGDPRYIERADRLWWKTSDYLYNPEEHLFFRDQRFFEQREANGRTVHWSRGNGWVVGGLVRMLEILPEDHPSRPKYVTLLREMAAALAALQIKDGYWTSSLLAPPPAPEPETSGTGFFCYALAWGVNHGILDEATYGPAVKRAWEALVAAVHPDGKLGWVQRAAAAPGTAGPDETEVYAVGGFLLAAAEVWEMTMMRRNARAARGELRCVHQEDMAAVKTMVPFDWASVTAVLPEAMPNTVVVRDSHRGMFLPVELLDRDNDGTPEVMRVAVTIGPNEERLLTVMSFDEPGPLRARISR